MTIILRANPDAVFARLGPSISWALKEGVLDADEARDLLADEIIDTIEVDVVESS